MALKVERVVDSSMHIEKALGRGGRLEPMHFTFSPSHGFIGNLQAPLGQKLLDVAVAQGKPEIKPDRVLDDYRRKAMSAVGELIHAGSLHRLRPRFCDIAAC